MFNGEFPAISLMKLGYFYMWLAKHTCDFDFHANCHGSSNVGMNFFDDESNVPTNEPIIHDSNPPPLYAYNSKVHSNVDDVHAIFQYSSNLCMD